MSDLREKIINQVFAAIASEVPITHDRGLALSTKIADAALAYCHQHDSHAEFVRAVKSLCVDRSLHRHEKIDEIEALCDRALCDAELAKEQP